MNLFRCCSDAWIFFCSSSCLTSCSSLCLLSPPTDVSSPPKAQPHLLMQFPTGKSFLLAAFLLLVHLSANKATACRLRASSLLTFSTVWFALETTPDPPPLTAARRQHLMRRIIGSDTAWIIGTDFRRRVPTRQTLFIPDDPRNRTRVMGLGGH